MSTSPDVSHPRPNAPRVDPQLRTAVAEALEATGRYTSQYEVLQQVVSGSRMNYVLDAHLRGSDATELVWCRGTYASIDQALSERFTLAREREVLEALSSRLDRVPVVLGSSTDGTVMIQRYVAEAPTADRAAAIPRYMRALDELHGLDVAALPWVDASEVGSARDAVRVEQATWSTLASQLVDPSTDLAAAERSSGLAGLRDQIERILDHLERTPVPDLEGRPDLVHGDAGRANYLVDADGEVWLIDWELAHAGHRYEDYAWIELRGLEDSSDRWCHEVVSRVAGQGSRATDDYAYFRTMIYFRSVVAIAARITAEPAHEFVPYLTQRLVENELLGWLSAGEHVDVAEGRRAPDVAVDQTRLTAWRAWSRSLAALTEP